jgi:hypothetical protein
MELNIMKLYRIYLTESDFLFDKCFSQVADLTEKQIEIHNQLGHVVTKTTIQIVVNSKRYENRKIKK